MPFPNLLPLGSPLPSEGLGEAFPFGEGTGVRLVVVVIEASSFPLGEAGLGLYPRLIPDNPSLIHPHSSLCTMTEYRVLSASSPLQPCQRIHGDCHH